MSDESPVPTGVLESGEFTRTSLKVRLYVMMFLQYFVQGSYLPVITVFVQDALGFESTQIGEFKAALSVGPLLAPFIIGQIVDRHFATEKVLAFCHFVGAALMLAIYVLSRSWSMEFYWLMVILGGLYSALYVPSMFLTNSLTFHHLKDRDREFPRIRLWGTIGFVVPLWVVEIFFLKGLTGDELDHARGIVLLVAAVAGFVMGAYSLTLPKTPPTKTDRKDLAPGKVIGLLQSRNFLVLVLVSLLVALAHSYFFLWNSPFLRVILDRGGIQGAWEGRIASIGQIFEVVVMAFLGFSIKRYGFKWTMAAGATAYMVRSLIFSGVIMMDGPFALIMTIVCVGQALHGFCFGCFLAVAYMYVDKMAPIDVRGSMQTFYGVLIVGGGIFLGGIIGGEIGKVFTTSADQQSVRDSMGIDSQAGMVKIVEEQEGRKVEKLRDWTGIWLAGAAISAVALLAFLLFFPNDKHEEKTAPHPT
ncbi:MAG: MFS transporter [Planctomycetes bacterium]|nr:MFS transporter [Planctomycetota bacterium]